MGQKVNPHGLRVGVIKDWDSRWYAEDKFAIRLFAARSSVVYSEANFGFTTGSFTSTLICLDSSS